MEIEIGTRVSIGASGKTGVVRYVGEVDDLAGEWVGIELDKPEGKHSGDLNGKVYFTCPPNHGVFVRKMQSENEELVDELRLENATQSSEIKSLEAEIAQQKARIAQFTASEQRKAEEVAHAIAKTSAGARKVESLEKQIAEHQEMIEKLILEKETLEVDKEIAEERVDLLEAEIEQLKASLALASSSQRPSQIPASAAELSEENMKLRAAIKALHDRNADEKNELNKKLRQLQRECAELVNLQEEVEQLARLEEQLTREREQFNAALDESHKDKIALDNLNRELRKQLKRSSDMEASMQSGSSRTKSALSQGDAEAFRKAFGHLHQELHRVRAQLAHERLDRVLGPSVAHRSLNPCPSSNRLAQCSREVARLSNDIRTRMSMPRMVDLTKTSASDQRLQLKLESSKIAQSLADLRSRISSVVKEEGLSAAMAHAIEQGEIAFGWQPPEMERPSVLVGRVTLRPFATTARPPNHDDDDDVDAMVDVEPTPPPPVPLLLNPLQVHQLSRALVC
ncbi:hypothetical protein P43SY_002665 [Pythium insidiosum]|uniref:CAP-Gly domain-containing protein n=1 Tax=Pythium insidiosum TaxID=114742 RepID=A0AAD5QDC8_PYTIN|nr:hypothetical protein P43SY_002665 [Pythium insidiosum]